MSDWHEYQVGGLITTDLDEAREWADGGPIEIRHVTASDWQLLAEEPK